jgi:hypothetical protein
MTFMDEDEDQVDASITYMVERGLEGLDVPPPHWRALRIAAFEASIAPPSAHAETKAWPAREQAMVDRARFQDLAFFHTHPDEHAYLRPRLPGECEPADMAQYPADYVPILLVENDQGTITRGPVKSRCPADFPLETMAWLLDHGYEPRTLFYLDDDEVE